MKWYYKYAIFILVFALGTYFNYLLQKSAGVTPNVFTTVIPGIIGSLSAWRYGLQTKNIRKL